MFSLQLPLSGPAFGVWVSIIALLLYAGSKYVSKPDRTSKGSSKTGGPQSVPSTDPYVDIDPLLDFDWRVAPKRKIWRLRPKYFLTMALEALPSLSDLVAMDETYLDQIELRRQIVDEQPRDSTHHVLPAGHDAVLELYAWLTRVYLPTRFPTVMPLHPASPLAALKALGQHVDTEFFVLLPTSTAEDATPIYHLQAYVNLSPTGFDTRHKMGCSLADIHMPVPSYKAILEKSMNRFFAKLEPGKAVMRTNWNMTKPPDLFVLSGNHLPVYDNEQDRIAEQQAEIERKKAKVVAEACRLRCERQTLHRLLVSKAIVFAFKTYMYSLDEIKADGRETAELLDAAIDGLDKGNAPDMKVYKSAVIWKDAVQAEGPLPGLLPLTQINLTVDCRI